MKKILLLALLTPSLLADTPATTITPGTGIIVNCDGCDEPPLPKDPEPEPAVKLVTECPKPKTIVKWKTKELVKWRTREVIKEVKSAPITNHYYTTGGDNQVHLNKPHRLTVLVGAPYKAVTEYELKDEDFAHTYPLVGIEYSQLLTQSINFSIGVWSDRFLFTGLGYNY